MIAEADHRPDIYAEPQPDGSMKVIYRASSLGNCIKALTAIRMGVEPAPFPEKFQKAFADGQRGEAVIIDAVRAEGYLVNDGQREVELIVGETPDGWTIVVRGHVDGLARHLHSDNSYVLECKTTTSRGISPHLQAKYDWQLSVYMHAYGFPGLFAIGTKDQSTGDVISTVIHIVETPPRTLTEITGRIMRIEAFARNGFMPECDTENRYPCAVYWLHDDEEIDHYKIMPAVVGNDEADRLAAAYKRYQAQEAEAKAGKEDARRQLLGLIGDGDKLVTPSYKVTRSVSATKRLDGKAMKAAGMEVIEVESEVEKLRVTAVGG